MNPIRKMLHQQFAQILGCSTDEEYAEKKTALLSYLRRVQPQAFALEGGRRRSFERMAEMEGMTIDEKLEDLALTSYLVQKSWQRTSKEEALAALSTCGLPEEDRLLVQKLIEEMYGSSSV